jgi:hypothetical protein
MLTMLTFPGRGKEGRSIPLAYQQSVIENFISDLLNNILRTFAYDSNN